MRLPDGCTCGLMANYPEGAPIGHTPDCALVPAIRAEIAEKKARCAAAGHRPLDVNNSGFGFGRFDYFCTGCETHLKAVPVAELNEKERRKVFGYAMQAAELENAP